MTKISEESLALYNFVKVSMAPVVYASGKTMKKSSCTTGPIVFASCLITVPWFILVSLPAFACASYSYGGILWPISLIKKSIDEKHGIQTSECYN